MKEARNREEGTREPGRGNREQGAGRHRVHADDDEGGRAIRILPRQIEWIVLSPRLSDAEAGALIRHLITGKGEVPPRLTLAVQMALDLLRESRADMALKKAAQRNRKGAPK